MKSKLQKTKSGGVLGGYAGFYKPYGYEPKGKGVQGEDMKDAKEYKVGSSL